MHCVHRQLFAPVFYDAPFSERSVPLRLAHQRKRQRAVNELAVAERMWKRPVAELFESVAEQGVGQRHRLNFNCAEIGQGCG